MMFGVRKFGVFGCDWFGIVRNCIYLDLVGHRQTVLSDTLGSLRQYKPPVSSGEYVCLQLELNGTSSAPSAVIGIYVHCQNQRDRKVPISGKKDAFLIYKFTN